MKNVVRFLAAVLAVASIVSVIGCSSGSEPAGSAMDRAVSIMKVLPANASGLYYRDIYMLRTDADLTSEWVSLQQQSEDNSVLEKMDGLGLIYDEMVMLYVGDFSLADLMGTASNSSYEYGGVKVETYTGNVNAALVKGVFLNTIDDYQMKRCIDVANDKEPSMYDSEDLKAILVRLPDGYMVVAWVVGNEAVPEGFAGLLAVAEVVARQGADDVQTTIYKFNASDAAQKCVETVRTEALNQSINVAVTQDALFVKVVATSAKATPTPTATIALTPEPTATPEATVTPTPAP